jgi:hypothetical protein
MLKTFISIFLSKFPDRLACLALIVSIVVLSSFAYDTAGPPFRIAGAATAPSGDPAPDAAIGWVYTQKCFSGHIVPDTIVTSTEPAPDGACNVNVDFVTLEYRVDPWTGGLHHIPINHTVSVLVSQCKVVSASEGLRDLINGQVYGPVAGVSREYL